jgi:hypothetical protein
MATYKGINGYAVQTVASDPSPGDPGQVFYNTTSKAFEYTTLQNGTWASGGSLGTGRQYLAGAGTQTAGLAAGGSTPPGNQTEEYDGTSWTAGGNLNIGREEVAGAGLQTSALGFGGSPTGNATELYDGTSWVTGGNLNTGTRALAGAGTQTAGLAFGGETYPRQQTEEFTGGLVNVNKTISFS